MTYVVKHFVAHLPDMSLIAFRPRGQLLQSLLLPGEIHDALNCQVTQNIVFDQVHRPKRWNWNFHTSRLELTFGATSGRHTSEASSQSHFFPVLFPSSCPPPPHLLSLPPTPRSLLPSFPLPFPSLSHSLSPFVPPLPSLTRSILSRFRPNCLGPHKWTARSKLDGSAQVIVEHRPR